MNGIHDMGGMHGMGPINPEIDEPVFHADWERRMFALWTAAFAAGMYNDNEFRFAIESRSAEEYLSESYYQHWLVCMEKVLIDKGQFTRADLEAVWANAPGTGASGGGAGSGQALPADQVIPVFMGGASARIDADVAPKFKAGDAVVARNINPAGHTRLPRYLRGKGGTIEKDHGVFGFPDSMAHGEGETPQHVYCVRFDAREVWGESAPARDSFYVDMWDDYLDPA
ncbi:MAG: nitrile hydratase subunit beta [Rhodospirillaceae bacterium]|jgi:nitrile hydratase subunit beta|nr:nitrile hydratase subunit beta [Rhodospirillaceae bacterium]MBT5674176.1 nitrile hydratase subunit beta [Rhodospirillaceae bacterium]MBT5779240.1 nitrile hydratase subunit beta [Rhodospirillaceae bacterium]MBT7293487.1 nitrile hydratase subunit beta [Rhodospirillaceae bacterium]